LFPLLWWRPTARDECGALRKMRGPLGQRVRRNAHDHDQFCSCAREVYWPYIYAFLLMFQEVRPIRKTCNQLTRKGLVELARIRQGSGNDFCHLLWGVCYKPSSPRPILQSVQPRFIEAFEPRADSGRGQVKCLCNRRHARTPISEQNHADTLHFTCRSCARTRSFVNRRLL